VEAPSRSPGLLAPVQSAPVEHWLGAHAARAAHEGGFDDKATEVLAWDVLGDDPGEIIAALDQAAGQGASAEQLARAVAYAAALRLTRFLGALGSALLNEDADFHWYQTYEAAVRQAAAWPAGSEPVALVLAGAARFLAAHTPTRRELGQVVRIAARLRRGEALYEDV
jgi:hypothetical protein